MALAELILGKPTFKTTILDANNARLLIIDAVVNLSTTFENELTDHPVEKGSDITDHVRQKNRVMEIEGVMSSSPIDLAAFGAGLITSAAGLIGGAAGSLGFGKQANAFGSAAGSVAGSFLAAALLGTSQDKAKDGYNILVQLMSKRKPLIILTSLDRYPNMIMTKLEFPRDPKTGGMVRFRASLREIRIVNALKATIPAQVAKGVNHTADEKKDLGAQATTQKDRSLAKGIFSIANGGS